MFYPRSAVLLLLASAASAGLFPPLALCQAGSISGQAVFSVGPGGSAITGMPYTAEETITQVQTLADGTQITHVNKRVQARDSQGRTRIEIYLPEGNSAANQNGNQPIFITIYDPVAGQWIHLNPRQKTATVNALPASPSKMQGGPSSTVRVNPQIGNGGIGSGGTAFPAQALPQAARTSARQNQTVEKLGGETIAGVYAEGRRITRVIPAGTQGNNRDITVVTEEWFSPDLKISVLSKTTDPRSGESTTEMKDLSREEPSPELFQVPEDYKIQTPQQN